MFVKVQCTFCQQTFDFDSTSGIPRIDCPHCGRQNEIEEGTGQAHEPAPRGNSQTAPVKPCPACRRPVPHDAVLCVHCGYNFATRKKPGDKSWLATNQGWLLLLGFVLIALAAGATFWLHPNDDELPLPPEALAPPKPAAKPAPAAAAATNEPEVPTDAAVAAKPENEPKPTPPPKPTPEEIAAQKAAAERAAAEAQKAQWERNLRLQLATRAPPYEINEPLELRRKNGLVDKGTLTSFSGTGTGRVVLVATPTGEIGVPLIQLDNSSRLRLDPEYREAYIQHMIETRGPSLPDAPPAKAANNDL